MESYVNPTTKVPGIDREQQIWTYRYGEASSSSGLSAPEDVMVITAHDRASLTWKAQPAAVGYAIFAGDGEAPWKVDFQRLALVQKGQTRYADSTAPRGKPRFYYVCAVDSEGKLGEPSRKARTQPRLVEDVVVSMISTKEARLSWPKSSAPDVAGYHVERALVEPFSEDQIERLRKDTPPLAEPSVGGFKAIGPFERLTRDPTPDSSFTDRSLDLEQKTTISGEPVMTHRFPDDRLNTQGKPYRYGVYAYRIRAVNKLGVESGPGPLAFTIPASPQWVFAKEEGETCHLRWAANAEQGVQGYRVYRMESPRINGPGQPTTRVTDDPVAATQFSDPAAGRVTRRYWIVAVDALGQEGFPSAPVWFQRQYRPIYQQFTGEWHQ
jgi:hypothetical protein